MKTAVLIPAYNAEETIAGLVKEVKSLGFTVIVIDDGSVDNTFKSADAAGAIIIKNEKNMGKGCALRKGFDYILKQDFDAVVTLDSDGQNEPASIKDFIKKAQESKAELVLGNRMHKTNSMPFVRVLTNKFMSFLLSLKAGQNIPDTQCGYRLIKKSLLEKMRLNCARYEIESEVVIRAGRLKAKMVSIPINSVYTGQVSHINPIVDTWRFVRFMMTI